MSDKHEQDQRKQDDAPEQRKPGDPNPDQELPEDQVANDNGPPVYAKELQDQSYPNRNMTAEERPEVPENGIEVSPEAQPQPQRESTE
jgi:hypothetical protein